MKRKTGFTLVETLITMTLAAFLLLIVWSMFDIYTKAEHKGVRASEQAAVVRAVERQMRDDLMRLVQVDPIAESLANSNPSLPQLYPGNGFLKGTGQELTFVNLSRSPEQLTVVSYRKNESPSEPKVDESTSQGVMRLEQSWLQSQRRNGIDRDEFSKFMAGRKIDLQQDDFLVIGGDQTDRSEQMAFASQPEIRDQIPEIQQWNFRYFDSGRWYERWDSRQRGKIPLAIEISFDTSNSKSESEDDEELFIRDQQEQAKEFRFVISLGLSVASDSLRGQR